MSKVPRISKKAPAAQSGFVGRTRISPFKRSSTSYGYRAPILSYGSKTFGLRSGKTQIAADKALKKIYGTAGTFKTEKTIFKQKAYSDAINKIKKKQNALGQGTLTTGFFKRGYFGNAKTLQRKMTKAVAGQKKYNAKSQKMIASLQRQGLVEKKPEGPLAEGMKQKSLSNVIGSLKAKREEKRKAITADIQIKTKELQTIVAQKQGLFNAYTAAARAVDQAKFYGNFPLTKTGQKVNLATLEAQLKVARDASKKFTAESAPAIRTLSQEIKAVKKVDAIATSDLYAVAQGQTKGKTITQKAKTDSFRQTLNVRQAKRNAKFSSKLKPTFFAKSRGIQAWSTVQQQDKLVGYITAGQEVRKKLESSPKFIPTPAQQKALKREMKALSVLGALSATGMTMSPTVSASPDIQKLLKDKATQSAQNQAGFQKAPVDLTGFKTRTQQFTQGVKQGVKKVGSALKTGAQIMVGMPVTGTKKVAPVVTPVAPVPLYEKVIPTPPPAPPVQTVAKGLASTLARAATSFVGKAQSALGLSPAAAAAPGTAQGVAPGAGVAPGDQGAALKQKSQFRSAQKALGKVFSAAAGTTPVGASAPTGATAFAVKAAQTLGQGVRNFLSPAAAAPAPAPAQVVAAAPVVAAQAPVVAAQAKLKKTQSPAAAEIAAARSQAAAQPVAQVAPQAAQVGPPG